MADEVKSLLLLVIVVLIIFCASGCAPQRCQSPGAEFIIRGNHLLDQGKYKEAIAEFRYAIGLDPQNAQAYRGLGIAYSAIEDDYRAEVFLRKALQLDKRMTELWGFLADIFLRKGDEKQAMAYFERCPVNDPHYAELHFRIGRMRLMANEIGEAEKEFEKTLNHADFWGGYWGKGMVEKLRGNWHNALKWYKGAYARSQCKEVLLGMAEVLDTLQYVSNAIFFYTMHLGTNSDEQERERILKRVGELENKIGLNSNGDGRKLEFAVSANSDIKALVCSKEGKIVKTIFSGMLTRGKYNLEWDGKDDEGKPACSGEYFGVVLYEDKCDLWKFIVQ